MASISYFNLRNSGAGRNGVSLKNSLIQLNIASKNLLEVLDRNPQNVVKHTISLTKTMESRQDYLLVDEILRIISLMNNHLDHILSAIQTGSLYDTDYKVTTTSGNQVSLVEALQDKWDMIVHKRRTDNFLNQTFGDHLDIVTEKINQIFKQIPLASKAQLENAA